MSEGELDRRAMLAAAAGAVGLGMMSARAGAGPLTPPLGPISPTGRTTNEIFDAVRAASPRTARPINEFPGDADAEHIISESGSYILTESVFTSKPVVIDVRTSFVQIEMGGHFIGSTAPSSEFPTGIRAPSSEIGLVVQNGSILAVVGVEAGSVRRATLRNLLIAGSQPVGARLGNYAVVEA